MKMDDKLTETLQQNEQIIQVVPADLLLEAWEKHNDTAKKWSTTLTAPALDLITASKIIKEFGFKANKVQIKTYANGKRYVIFKGYAGQRNIFKGTRYLADSPKVVRMAIGPKGIAKSIKGGFVLTFVLASGIEVMDYIINDKATLSVLLGTLSADFFKIGLSSIAAALAATAAGGVVVFGSAAASPFLIAIAVGVATGYLLDKIDKRLGVTYALIQAFKEIGQDFAKMEYEYNRGIQQIERNPGLIRCLFAPCDTYYIRGY
jgi:hypothetical protein